jgi:hypothetical protein
MNEDCKSVRFLICAVFSCFCVVAVTDFPKYDDLIEAYPKSSNGVPAKHRECSDVETSDNHCALRLSIALEKAGSKIDETRFKGKLCKHGYARGASDLAAYLKSDKILGDRDLGFESPGKLPENLKGKTGIILFEKIPGFDGQGHIDLFDGTNGLTGTYWNAKTIWFWELK